MDDLVQYRGFDRAKYDLTDPYASKYVARDKALDAANVALVARAMGWNCAPHTQKCQPKK